MSAPAKLNSPLTRTLIKAMSRAHTRLYRVTGGLLGSRWRIGSAFPGGVPICLVTTRGRRSGQPRTAPLLYLLDEERVVLVASQGGMASHPAWYHNILAHAEVEIRIGRTVRRLRARVADPGERAVLWPRLTALYPDFDTYQSWTDREIPVVVCA